MGFQESFCLYSGIKFPLIPINQGILFHKPSIFSKPIVAESYNRQHDKQETSQLVRLASNQCNFDPGRVCMSTLTIHVYPDHVH